MSGSSPGGVGLAFSPGGGFTVETGGFAFAPGKQTPSPRAQGRSTPASAASASSGGAAFYVREASASPLSGNAAGGGFTTGLFSFGGNATPQPQPTQPSASPQQQTPLPPFTAFAPGLAPAWATPGFKPPAPAFGAWSPMPQQQPAAPPPMAFSPGVATRPAPRGRATGAGGSPRGGGGGASSPTFGAPPPTPPTPAFSFAPPQQQPAAMPPPPPAAAQAFAAAAASFPAASAASAGPSPPPSGFAPGAQSGSPRGPPRRAVRTARPPPRAAAAATPPAAHKPPPASPAYSAAAVDGLASLMRNTHLRRSPAATSAADEDSCEDTSDLDEDDRSPSRAGSAGKRAHGAAASPSSPYPAAYVPQGAERAALLKEAATRAYRGGRYGRAEELYTSALEAARAADAPGREVATILTNRAAARLSGRGDAAAPAALRDCAEALAVDAGHARARLRAASCRLRLGQYGAARADVAAVAGAPELAEPGGAALAAQLAALSADADAAQGALRSALRALAAAGVCAAWPGAADAIGGDDAAAAGGDVADPAAEALAAATDALARAPLCVAAARAKTEALLLRRRAADAVTAAEHAAAAHAANAETLDDRNAAQEASDWWPAWTAARIALATGGDAEAAAAAMAALDPAPPAGTAAAQEALRLAAAARASGNASFGAKSWAEAHERYSAGIAAWAPPRRSAAGSAAVAPSSLCPTVPAAAAALLALLLCNRAAAAHAMGQRLEALADCGVALALVPNHAKALSRRATLHAEVRLLPEAVADLEALSATAAAADYAAELPARLRAAKAAAAVRPAPPPDAYAALGLARSGGSGVPTEARKAFRRAALRLHPDKAPHALPAAAGGGGIESTLASDAQRLFKLASDALEALSDDASRRSYDAAEALRAARAARAAQPPPPRGYHANAAHYARQAYAQPRGRTSYGGYHYASYADEDEEDEEPEPDFYSYRRYGYY